MDKGKWVGKMLDKPWGGNLAQIWEPMSAADVKEQVHLIPDPLGLKRKK